MKIFYSWESDHPNKMNRGFIKDCLERALKQLKEAADVDPADRPEIDQDTRGVPGMVDIKSVILEKIDLCHIFVADITPVGRTDAGKLLPNPNVMFELGYAAHTPGHEHTIGVLNTHGGVDYERLPFDLRGRKVARYELGPEATVEEKKNARADLVSQLEERLKLMVPMALSAKHVSAPITRTPKSPTDRSIWDGNNQAFTAYDSGSDLLTRIASGSRAYARIAPASWANAIPTASEIAAGPLRNKQISSIPNAWGSGTCEQGFVSYGIEFDSTTRTRTCTAGAFYLEEIGEYWAYDVHQVVDNGNGRYYVNFPNLVSSWNVMLKAGIVVLDAHGASKRRHIEVGITRIKGAGIVGYFPNGGNSRMDEVFHEQDKASWDDEKLRSFLAEAFNKLLNAFSQKALSIEEFTSKLLPS